ncbi:MAG: beta-ketoacyl synthase N-terminal-like domain-containing protein [Syntrophales bacterium]
MSGLYIHSASAFIGGADTDANLLKEELRRYARENFRRVNRFILLALIGARKCIQGRTLSPDTGVYLTTEHGNLGDTAAVLDEIYAAGSLPKPFSFINTMSNTAAFYLAQNLGTRGRNITVSSQCFSFERGLDLLAADFAAAAERSALIGGVDIASLSGGGGEDRGNRGWPMVAGSGWFYVLPEREGAGGVFSANRSFWDGAACLTWLRGRGDAPADVVAFGAAIGADEAARWQEALGPVLVFDYLGRHGYCGSAVACGIALFLQNYPGRRLLHINRDPRGNYALLEVEAFSAPAAS